MKFSRKLVAAMLAFPLAGTAAVAVANPGNDTGEYVSLDNQCFTMQINSPEKVGGQGFVTKGKVGYLTNGTNENAEPIAFEATYTGRYRLLDTAGKTIYASVFDEVWAGDGYGERGDWTITPQGDEFKIVATKNSKTLGTRLGKLAVGNLAKYHETSFTLTPASGCFEVPQVGIDMISGPTDSPINSDGTINGIMDGHGHLLSSFAFGGKLFCGDAFSPGGVDQALAPCRTHQSGAGTFFEMLLSGTEMYEPTKMWPTFENRPKPTTLLTQTGYYTGVERAFQAGVRAMNIVYVGNRVICDIYPEKGGSCNEMAQVRAQAAQLNKLIDHIDAQAGGPGKGFMRVVTTPEQMRQAIADGKMAITLAMEVSEPFGCDGITGCTKAEIDAGLDEIEAMGVSNIFLVHKFDNALGGTRFDNGATGIIMTFGNVVSNGTFFEVEKCEGEEADNPIAMPADEALETYKKLFGKDYAGKLPLYPSGPACNRVGLTDLGKYTVGEAMKRGMIINVDHMGVKTIKDTLNLTNAAGYPGLATAHTWSDPGFYEDVVSAGGFYGSYLFEANEQLQRWKDDHAITPSLDHYGIGPDITGMGPLPGPRTDAATKPLEYPFTAPSGAVFDKNVWGERTWDLNKDGMSTYGLLPDYLADLIQIAGTDGPALQKDLMSSAEAWVKTWEGAVAWANNNK